MRWCFCFCSAELSWYATVTIAGGSETTVQSRRRSMAAAASLLARWPRAPAHFIFVLFLRRFELGAQASFLMQISPTVQTIQPVNLFYLVSKAACLVNFSVNTNSLGA